jgi:hypothetical protein
VMTPVTPADPATSPSDGVRCRTPPGCTARRAMFGAELLFGVDPESAALQLEARSARHAVLAGGCHRTLEGSGQARPCISLNLVTV